MTSSKGYSLCSGWGIVVLGQAAPQRGPVGCSFQGMDWVDPRLLDSDRVELPGHK